MSCLLQMEVNVAKKRHRTRSKGVRGELLHFLSVVDGLLPLIFDVLLFLFSGSRRGSFDAGAVQVSSPTTSHQGETTEMSSCKLLVAVKSSCVLEHLDHLDLS